MAIAHVASTLQGGTQDGVTTGTIDTTGANFLARVDSWYFGGPTPTTSDSYGNIWQGLTAGGGETLVRISYCASAIVGAGHTFTSSTTGGFPTVYVAAFSGVAASPFDQETMAPGLSPGAITPGADGAFMVTGICTSGASSPTIGGGWAYLSNGIVGGQHMGGGGAYLIQTTAVSSNPVWVQGGGNASAQASFLAAAGGSGTDTPLEAEPGEFTLNGSPAGFAIGLTAVSGLLTPTGSPANFATGLTASPGALTLTGSPASFGLAINAEPVALTLIGFAAELVASGNAVLDAQPGTLTLTGFAAGFAIGFATAPGSLTVSGQPSSYALVLAASPAALTLTGFPATLALSGEVLMPGGVFRRAIETWSRSFARALPTWPRTFQRKPATWARVWRYDPMSLDTEGKTIIAAVSDDREYGFDCSAAPELRDGTELTIASGAIIGGDGLTIGTVTVLDADFDDIPSGKGLKVRISGGVAGTVYKFACRVTLSNSRQFVVPARMRKVPDYAA